MSTTLTFWFENGKSSTVNSKNDPGFLHLPGISDSFRLNCASEGILKSVPWNGESVSLFDFWTKVISLIENSPKNIDGAAITKITLTESSGVDAEVPLIISLTPTALKSILGIVNDPAQYLVTSRPPRIGVKRAKVIDESKWELLELE